MHSPLAISLAAILPLLASSVSAAAAHGGGGEPHPPQGTAPTSVNPMSTGTPPDPSHTINPNINPNVNNHQERQILSDVQSMVNSAVGTGLSIPILPRATGSMPDDRQGHGPHPAGEFPQGTGTPPHPPPHGVPENSKSNDIATGTDMLHPSPPCPPQTTSMSPPSPQNEKDRRQFVSAIEGVVISKAESAFDVFGGAGAGTTATDAEGAAGTGGVKVRMAVEPTAVLSVPTSLEQPPIGTGGPGAGGNGGPVSTGGAPPGPRATGFQGTGFHPSPMTFEKRFKAPTGTGVPPYPPRPMGSGIEGQGGPGEKIAKPQRT